MTKRVPVSSSRGVRRWKQWSAEDARGVLDAWRSSGQTLTTYARASGVSPDRLRRWSVRLDAPAESLGARPSALVPLVVRPTPHFAPVLIRLPGDVTLELADAASAPATWVVEVVKGLARSSR